MRILLRKMIDRGVNRMAVCIYRDLAQLFRWAEKRQPWRGLMQNGNPADLIDIEQITDVDYDIYGVRERVLSPDEIFELRDIFFKMENEYKNTPTSKKYSVTRPLIEESQLALWICLSTLCRIGELLMTQWKDITFGKGEWFIPKTNIKGRVSKKQDHLIFLSPFALKQFRRLHVLTGQSEWCFPNKKDSSHVYEKTVTKQVGDRQTRFKSRKEGGLAKRCNDDALVLANGANGAWTPHDLRRTGATMMQALKISPEVIDRCQNHVLKGSRVRRHYLHYDYADEKRKAWNKLGERLEKILK